MQVKITRDLFCDVTILDRSMFLVAKERDTASTHNSLPESSLIGVKIFRDNSELML